MLPNVAIYSLNTLVLSAKDGWRDLRYGRGKKNNTHSVTSLTAIRSNSTWTGRYFLL